jgi:acetyl esterase/lipase
MWTKDSYPLEAKEIIHVPNLSLEKGEFDPSTLQKSDTLVIYVYGGGWTSSSRYVHI